MKLKNNGFTLMETVVAMTIAAVALSFFISAFVPATAGIQRSRSLAEARLLSGALESELHTLRPGVDSAYNSAFEKAFEWIAATATDAAGFPTGGEAIIGFKYRADALMGPDADGLHEEYKDGADFTSATESDSQPMAIKTRFVKIESGDLSDEDVKRLGEVDGSAFIVVFNQLTNNTTPNAISLGGAKTAGQLEDSSGSGVNFTGFLEASILAQADFYILSANSPGYINRVIKDVASGAAGDILPSRPIHSFKFGVRR